MSYRPQLDSLRALAVMGVLYSHFYSEKLGFGPLGVRVFFVLSGFLITRILLNQRAEISGANATRLSVLRSFYMRRILRIFPAFYLFILAASIVSREMRDYFWWHALFGSNLLFAEKEAYLPGFSAHLWSLSVEEQFYLLWPALVLFLPSNRIRPAIMAIIAFSLASKLTLWSLESNPFPRWFLPTSSLDALAAGALLASGVSLRQTIVRTSVLGIVAGLLVQYSLESEGQESWPVIVLDTLMLIPIAGLILGAHNGFSGITGSILSSRLLIYLGRISYGIYLYHLLVMVALLYLAQKLSLSLHQYSLAMMTYGTVATLIVASASWRYFEKPINSLKRNI